MKFFGLRSSLFHVLSVASYKQEMRGLSWRLRTSRQNLFFVRARQGLKQVGNKFSALSFLPSLFQTFAGTHEEKRCADVKGKVERHGWAIAS